MSIKEQPPVTQAPAAAAPPPTGRWVPLGIAFGALSTIAILLFGPLGVSTTYPRAIGALLETFKPGNAQLDPYLSTIGIALTPESLVVVGLLIGGFLAARFNPKPASCPMVQPKGYARAFLGGFLLLFGARLAGGCTSGHVISGITQLSVSGLLFGAGVFATGITTAKLLKGRAS